MHEAYTERSEPKPKDITDAITLGKNLAHIPDSQPVVDQHHDARLTAFRNSSCDKHMDGSLSISSERRNASETPSSSSLKTSESESSNSAANLARSDSGSLNANDSTSVRLFVLRAWIGSDGESSCQ